jgi:HK97 family phage major capsid protein
VNKLQELRQKYGEIADEIKKLADIPTLSAEQRGAWDKANADLASTREQIERQESALALAGVTSQRASQPGAPAGSAAPTAPLASTPENRSLAIVGLILRAKGLTLPDKCQRALADLAIHQEHSAIHLRMNRTPAEMRGINTQVGANGGFIMPTETISPVERAMLFFGSVRNLSTVLSTPNGNRIEWPTTNDTSSEGELIGEEAAVTEGNPTFAQKAWDAYTLSSKVIKLSFQALQDAPESLETLSGDMVGERLARGQNRYLTTGTGASQPYGVVTASTLGKTAASATAIAADELIDLLHSVDPAYRMGARWMLNDGIMAAIRKLKGSGSGDYLFQPGLQLGVPDMLLGYPVSYNNHMQATVASGTKTVLFGDFSRYKVREVQGIRFQVLNELYAANGQVGIQAFMRFDGNILNAGVAPIKHLIQA